MPFRLYLVWLMAAAAVLEQRRREALEVAAARAERVRLARRVLFRDGTMRRVARVRRAIRREEFHERFMAKDRASARRLEDLCEMAVGVLVDMGVDMKDVQLTMRRAGDRELRFRPLPSLEVARRALATVDDQPLEDDVTPLDELLAAVSDPPAPTPPS